MTTDVLAKTIAAIALVGAVMSPAVCAPYKDEGPVLNDFDGSPYEAVLVGTNGAKATFGLKQIAPQQIVAMRGRTLVVFGTLRDADENRSVAREEAASWVNTSEPTPNWPPPDVRIVADKDVKEEDLGTQDVVLIGGADSNSITAIIANKLPIRPSGSDVDIPGSGTLGSVIMGRFLVPSPFAAGRFLTVRFGSLHVKRHDVRWSVAYRWTAALTYFWHTTDYSFITKDGTIRGGYFEKLSRTDWVYDPKLTVTVPNIFRDPYQDWVAHRTLHFVFHAAPRSTAAEQMTAMGKTWDKDWEGIYSQVSGALGVDYDRSIHVFFFDDLKDAGRCAAVGFSPINASDQRAAGLTEAGLGVILLIGKENAAPTVTARHEIAHILAEKIAPPTVAFNAEGLASAMEGDRPSQTSGKSLRDWEADYLKANSGFPPISAMLRSEGFSAYPVRESYPLAAGFARFLIDTYGLKKYKDYYKSATEEDPQTALEQTYGKPSADLEDEWEARVRADLDIRVRASQQEQEADEAYRKRDFGAALRLALKATEADPDVVLAYFIVGACYNRIKEPNADAAIAALEKYEAGVRKLGLPEQPWTYIELGYSNDLKGERTKACLCYEKAAELPDDRGSREEAKKRLVQPFRNGGR